MKTKDVFFRNAKFHCTVCDLFISKVKCKFNVRPLIISALLTIVSSALLVQCSVGDVVETAETTGVDPYIIDQAISDEAQGNTIAFDGLGFMSGNLGSQTFLPPGKVADYSGFQYLRDNDPTQLGHNTSFVTIISVFSQKFNFNF